MTDFGTPDCAGPDPHPRAASFPVPRRACDCHAHVIGPQSRYPYVSNRSYTPPEALIEDYLQLLQTLGFSRAVLVQPSLHGTDHRPMLEALAGAAAAGIDVRMVGAIAADTSDENLARLHDQGMRGVRLNLVYRGGGLDWGSLPDIAARIRSLGWHLELLANVSEIGSDLIALGNLDLPLVIDHLGHLPSEKGVGDAGFAAMLELLRRGNTWVKLSGAYRLAQSSPFPNPDIDRMARMLVDANPDHVLWGTDWPHTMCPVPMPNDGDLLDLLRHWAGDRIDRILVENPAKLYGFS